MAAAGFKAFRMAEFTWSRLEPNESIFNFTWLDHLFEFKVENGIRSWLSTQVLKSLNAGKLINACYFYSFITTSLDRSG